MVKINRIKQHNYTVIDNQLACDQQLSWHARGIFLYLYAHGDEWEFLEQEVIAENIARHDTFMQGIAELEAAGYLRCSKLQADSGEILESLWELAMTPVFKNDPQIQLDLAENVAISGFSPRTGFPATDNPPLEKPVLENPPLRSTNKTNTKYNKQQTKQSSNPGEGDGPKETVEDACTEIIRYLNVKTGRRYNPEFESPKEIRERLGLANPHSLIVFKAAIIAMRDAQMVEEEFSLDKAMKMFDSLMVLEMLDRQCLVDYDYVIIERSRMFYSAIKTQIQAYVGTDNQLIFQVATISEDDDLSEVVCEYQVNLLEYYY